MSTKRKIEDYKNQKVAIHCSTKEEWDKIVDLFPSDRSIKKIYWQNSVNNGKSDTIKIDGYGWSPKKHYEDKGGTIYPASDFLEEIKSISKKVLKEGEIYLYDNEHICVYPKGGSLSISSKKFNNRHTWIWNLDIKSTTDKQKDWLNECIKANKFIPYDVAMGTFIKEKPFKFNIGDEIKAKPGGYYFSDPKFFAKSHKKQFPSEKSTISGKITERTQAQGFNWYRCDNGNWITEEGIELVKEDIPEYVECYHLDRNGSDVGFTIGKVYKVTDGSPIDDSGHCRRVIKVKEWKHWFKSSTREAFDLQNKPKTMNEDVFCIKLNSQEELDAIMDFYKQKGFKELGDSHEYYTGYVVFIKMKNKKWQTSVCNDLDYPVKTLSELGIEVKSKSLVGRYVKALRNITILKKGDYDLILSENPTLFQCEKSLSWSKSRFEEGDFELMPEGFKPEDDLISEAKKRYPIGTKFRPAHIPGSDITEYCIVTEDSIFHKNGDGIVLTINGCWWDRENPKYGNTNYNRVIYHEGKWAEIVSDEPEINTYGLKVGDTLKAEIINTWSLIEGNFCSNVQRGWVGVFGNYIEDRKIEDFRNIDGQIGFHVSGCAKGTHYLKAEGFKEFADNFYKKEMLEMLPYPKDNYFKAVVVKDIHKKDITTQGNIPDLIPKGYQTWFRDVGTNYRERIFQNECIVCPENNRWKANIPAEYFQIVGDDKYNNIPKECYPSNEIIIPQIIKAQKTIQKITIESPTELDLKLKTIKPKQIQTIKI